MHLKLYADKAMLPPGVDHVQMLVPFWGPVAESASGGEKDRGRFIDYAAQAPQFFSLSDRIEDANAAVLPMAWGQCLGFGADKARMRHAANEMARTCVRLNKPLLVFFVSDSSQQVPLPNAVVLRTSFTRSRRRPEEFAIPGWSIDFQSAYLNGETPLRPKTDPPSVGYCGYVDYLRPDPISLAHHAWNIGLGRLNWTGAALRGKAVRALREDSRVTVNLVVRHRFSGPCGIDERLEYVRNITDSQYALVARGKGNFSYRLYEVLSCGRIPLFVDTDCVLPFNHIIDWHKYCVWLAAEEVSSAAGHLLRFHQNVTQSRFIELQREIRALYEEWICPTGFFRNLWRYLDGSRPGSRKWI